MLTARLLLLCCAGLSPGATIQYFAEIPPYLADPRPGLPPLHFVLELPKFNPNLGTLQRIDIEGKVSITGAFFYENLSSTEGIVYQDLKGSLLGALPGLVYEDDDSAPVGPYDGMPDFGGESGGVFDIDMEGTITRSLLVPDNSYTGLGALFFDMFGDAGEEPPITSTIDPEFFLWSGGVTVSYRATLAYTYEPAEAIPEPSTALMLFVALVGMLVNHGGCSRVRDGYGTRVGVKCGRQPVSKGASARFR